MADENQELDLIDLEYDDGTLSTWQIQDYFFYNGEEYAILYPYPAEAPEGSDLPCLVMKINPFTDENGEEMDEFVSVDDEKMIQKLIDVASTRLTDSEEEEEV